MPKVEVMGGLRWSVVVPLAVPKDWAWACPATHGGERSVLRLEPPSLAQGHLQQDGTWPVARPQPRVAGPRWPKGHSMALHAQLQQKCVRGSQGCPALGAPEALLCSAPLRERRPTPHLPPDRRQEQPSRARPHHCSAPLLHTAFYRAQAQSSLRRLGSTPRARARTADAPLAPPLSPGSGRLKR